MSHSLSLQKTDHALQLQIGDLIGSSTSAWNAIEGIAPSGNTDIVYNFHVEDDKTYFVGDATWGWDAWVHNEHRADAELIQMATDDAAVIRASETIPKNLKPKTAVAEYVGTNLAKDQTVSVVGRGRSDRGNSEGFHPALREILESTRPRETWPQGTCAEVKALNDILMQLDPTATVLKSADVFRIMGETKVATAEIKTGELATICRNCQDATPMNFIGGLRR